MNNTARHELCALIEDYGEELCRDIDKCRDLLLALCGDHPFETIALVQGLEFRVPQEILDSPTGVSTEMVNSLVRRLIEQAGEDEEKARWCVESWAIAFDKFESDEEVETKKIMALPATVKRKIQKDKEEEQEAERIDPAAHAAQLSQKILSGDMPASTPLPLLKRRKDQRRPRSIKDPTDPLAELWRAAESGDPTAMTKMGRIYLDGVGGEEVNIQMALDWLEEAAALDDGEAWFLLGQMCLYGQGVEEDEGEAAYYLECAAEAGHALSMKLISEMYTKGKGITEDPERAYYWSRKYAETEKQLRQQNAKHAVADKELQLAPGVSMRLIRVRSSSFLMGSPPNEPGRLKQEAQHLVQLTKDFWIAETPITQAQWYAVMGTSVMHMRNATYNQWPLRGIGNNYPMYYISWNDAMDFCSRVTDQTGFLIQLPSEAQWEYACRAGTSTPYWMGLDITPNDANYRSTKKSLKGEKPSTTPVKKHNPNPWGIYDMHGNVWEWCLDWYGEYPRLSQRDPRGVTRGDKRIIRGGSWLYPASHLRSAFRGGINPDYRRATIGFRVVHTKIEF